VQLVFLEMLQQRAADAVDDAFGHAGRPRRIHDIERMVERQRREVRLRRRVRRDEAGVGNASRQPRRERVRLLAQVRHQDRPPRARQLREQCGQLGFNIDGLAVVPITVGRDQHLGLGLTEAIEHALNPEIRGGAGKHRADAGGRQHRHHRFRQIR